MYTYGWFTLSFDRKQQNSSKQLSFNKKINFKKGGRRYVTRTFCMQDTDDISLGMFTLMSRFNLKELT